MTREEFAERCNNCKYSNSTIGLMCDFCEDASNFESKYNMPHYKSVKTRSATELLRYRGTTLTNITAPTRSLPMNYSFDNVMNTDITKELTWLRQYYTERNNTMGSKTNGVFIPNEYRLYFDDFTRLTIKNVIFNDPATIVFWSDGTKTVVKAENEEFDPEKGLAMVIAKKFLGNKGSYYNEFKKWIK